LKKRIIRTLASALAMLLIVGGISWYLYHQNPSWYHLKLSDSQTHQSTVNDAIQKLGGTFSWAAGIRAQFVRQSRGESPSATSTSASTSAFAAGPNTITLTEDEINALLQNWNDPETGDLQQGLQDHFSNGCVALVDHQIILAAESKELGAVLSIVFEPTVNDSGQLDLQMQGIYIGRLRIPHAALAGKLGELRQTLAAGLAEDQPVAHISASMVANPEAAGAGWTRMLIDAIDGQPSEPVIFMPFDLRVTSQLLAVHVTNVQISEGSITLTLEPISVDQRKEIEARLKRKLPG
jgi:hypothetical protein